ncbi:MAG: flagellar basal body-associated FliL family protein [Lachnospiraceae bacterium]|nr:flagellar basal body-associated FliL family protein [Lachnospiraceae bacterium]
MKKNFLSILILGCTLINIVLSAVTMFSVVTTNRETGKIVGSVADILDLKLDAAADSEHKDIPIEDIAMYSIPESMTVELKSDPDGTSHFCMVSVCFSMDTKHEDYKKYGATVAANELIYRSIVVEVFREYTITEARASQEELCDEILARVQDKYQGSDFIFEVSFSDIKFQ